MCLCVWVREREDLDEADGEEEEERQKRVIPQSQVVAQLTLLVAITVLHRSCSVAAELKTASPSPRRL